MLTRVVRRPYKSRRCAFSTILSEIMVIGYIMALNSHFMYRTERHGVLVTVLLGVKKCDGIINFSQAFTLIQKRSVRVVIPLIHADVHA